MKKLITNLLVLVAVFFGVRFVLNIWTASRFMEHTNECHAELHIGERIHQAMSAEQSNAMYAEFEKCIADRSNFPDLMMQKATIKAYIEALKEDPKLRAR